jgi:site-specific DNA-methyltransferase (adenine-specific)
VRRFVQASSRPGDLCLDPFAGSGTLGAVARALGRRYLLIDHSSEAVEVMRRRLGEPVGVGGGTRRSPGEPDAG